MRGESFERAYRLSAHALTQHTIAEYQHMERKMRRSKWMLRAGAGVLSAAALTFIGLGEGPEEKIGLALAAGGIVTESLAIVVSNLHTRYETILIMHEDPSQLVQG